jgi:protoporphyrinogen oxidase
MNKRVAVVGGGFAGLACCSELARTGDFEVILIEANGSLGGLAGGISNGHGKFDFGSHRLHASMHESARKLLTQPTNLLAERTRYGKLRLRDSFTRYPPSLLGLASCLGVFGAGQACLSHLLSRVAVGSGEGRSYEDVLLRSVGVRMYEQFYKPYAIKVFGRQPTAISDTAVMRWFSAETGRLRLAELALRSMPSRREKYLYPPNGFGELAGKLGEKMIAEGVSVRTSTNLSRVVRHGSSAVSCVLETPTGVEEMDIDWLVNTACIDEQAVSVSPSLDRSVVEAASNVKWRALRLVYVITTSHKEPGGPDTLYFPELEFPFGRISYPSRFSARMGCRERESLCIEVICSVGDRLWRACDDDLVETCLAATESAGVLAGAEADECFTLEFPKVYPVYDLSWRKNTGKCLKALSSVDNYIPAGRMGLFLHCNIDHAIAIGASAAKHIRAGKPARLWHQQLGDFGAYRVRD